MIKYDLPAREYHAIRAVSASYLKKFARTPAHARWSELHPMRPTEQMVLGTITHTIVFEPEKLASQFHLEPKKLDGRTKEGKEQAARVAEMLAAGTEVFYDDQLADARAMAAAVRDNPEADSILKAKARCEVTLLNELGDIPVKARLDHLTDDGWIDDLKTTKDASPRGFQRTIVDLGYHIQAAFYIGLAEREGLKPQGFRFIAVENQPPFLCAVYELAQSAILAGRKQIGEMLSYYQQCRKWDQWPGYPTISTIDLPDWFYKSKN